MITITTTIQSQGKDLSFRSEIDSTTATERETWVARHAITALQCAGHYIASGAALEAATAAIAEEEMGMDWLPEREGLN